jgi:hypothetical protein
METLFTQLDHEWDALIRRPDVGAELAEACALAGAQLPDLVRTVRREPSRADAVLAHLIERDHDGSAVAARAVLQLLIPGMCGLTTRWRILGSPEDRAAATVAAVYERIRRYPLQRRPRSIAANILLDAASELRRLAERIARELDRTVEVAEDWFIAQRATDEKSPPEQLREVIDDAVRSGRVRPEWAALVVATRIGGHDLATVATTTGTPVRTLQWRRRAAEAALVAEAAA